MMWDKYLIQSILGYTVANTHPPESCTPQGLWPYQGIRDSGVGVFVPVYPKMLWISDSILLRENNESTKRKTTLSCPSPCTVLVLSGLERL